VQQEILYGLLLLARFTRKKAGGPKEHFRGPPAKEVPEEKGKATERKKASADAFRQGVAFNPEKRPRLPIGMRNR
jgi:hypothetical protein